MRELRKELAMHTPWKSTNISGTTKLYFCYNVIINHTVICIQTCLSVLTIVNQFFMIQYCVASAKNGVTTERPMTNVI